MQKIATTKARSWLIPLIILAAAPLSLAANVQEILNRKITIELEDVSLSAALNEIEAAAGVKFVYSASQLDLTKRISLNAEKQRLAIVLNNLLGPLGITYTVEPGKEYILLKPLKAGVQVPAFEKNPAESALPVQSVTGTVTDASTQQPIAGVNIVVKGTTSGTTTDADGKYAITADEDDILIFSFIGYKKFETQVGGRSVIDVTLEEDVAALAPVIVNGGYYHVRERMKTGNIARVTAKEIERQPVTSPLLALQGRVAGIEIIPYNGVPGNAPMIRIRGQNSLRIGGAESDGNFPLFIVDGVPIDPRPINSVSNSLIDVGFDPLSTLNINDIESIEVLKDADATAIYGSRGANGVILITTKKGRKAEKTTVNASAYRGVGEIAHRMKLLNTQQYVQMRKEAFLNDGLTKITGNDLLKWDTTRHTDWQEELLGGSSQISDVQLGLSGGSAGTSFRLGGDIHSETTVFPGDFGYRRVNGNLSVNHTSTDGKFTASASVLYGFNNNKLFNDYQLIGEALSLPPNAPALYTPSGELNWEDNTWKNPLSRLLKTQVAKINTFLANSELSFEILPSLILKANLGFTSLNSSDYNTNPLSAINPALLTPKSTASAFFGTNARMSWTAEPQVNYERSINDHTFNLIAGATLQLSKYESQIIEAYGYKSDVLLHNTSAASLIYFKNDDNTEYRYMSGFARLGYNFREKYLASVTARRDGSSRFGPGRKYSNFGSIGMAWIISNESFLKNARFLTFGKIRASYGTSGSDQIGDYKYFDSYTIQDTPYNGVAAFIPTGLFNPDYAWERTQKQEAAVEAEVMNRIFLEISWYRHQSSNQLVPYQLPATTGFTSIIANINATIQNKGIELILSSRNIEKERFKWTTSLNYSAPRNKLVSFPNFEESPYRYTYMVGEPLGIQKFYKYSGVDPESGEHIVVDADENGIFNDVDKTEVVNFGSVFYGGLSNNIQLGNFEVGFLVQFSKQNGLRYTYSPPGFYGNQSVDILDRWQSAGETTDVQRFTQTYGTAYIAFFRYLSSNAVIDDASFLRLKTATISYHFPNAMLDKLKIEQATVFLQGQNLFTATSFTGLDPETGRMSLPPLKVLTLGISLKL